MAVREPTPDYRLQEPTLVDANMTVPIHKTQKTTVVHFLDIFEFLMNKYLKGMSTSHKYVNKR